MTEIIAKWRTLGGTPRTIERALLVALALVGGIWATQLHHYLPWAIFNEQYLGLFLGLGLAPVFLAVKARPQAPPDVVPWYDWILVGASLVVGGYVAILYPTIAYELGLLTWDKVLLGGTVILLVLEGVRRLAGWALMWIGLACLLYANLAWLLPGILYAKGSSWSRIVVYLYLDTNGILGLPLAVTATVVVAYIFFGQALYAVGGDKFLTDVALVAMGRYRGGPAKMAVVSSSLYGMVSGSAVANVVVDGAITIPMMKRSGYPSHLAAAIEAVSSNGGQIMPPVMGAAAFLIAEYLAIPYGEVALAAAIPACLYYLALFVQVDLEAAKLGLAGLPREQIPVLRGIMRGGWVFLVPLAVLIYTLMLANWEAGKAGMLAMVTTFAVGAIQKVTRPSARAILDAVEATGRTMLDLVAITTLAGVVIGAFQLSGLTSKLPMLLMSAAGSNVLLLLVLTAIVSILLGMSLPTTVVYITLAVLVGPALAQMGILPLAAHLFLFYFGMLSLITPPDCLATYAAAAIAKSDFWQTGWTGMRLGIVAYVVPFVFVFHPALLLRGTLMEITLAILTASLGVILLGIGCAGYLFRSLGWGRRAWTIAAGLSLMMPPVPGVPPLVFDGAGLLLGGLLVITEWSAGTRRLAEKATLAVLLALAAGAAGASEAVAQSPEAGEHRAVLRTITDLPGRTDPALRAKFLAEYAAVDAGARRALLRSWLFVLGADGLLDALETRSGFCHWEGHDLGKEILGQTKDVGAALGVCGERCTVGCTHGVLMAAFVGDGNDGAWKHATVADVRARIRDLCAPGGTAGGIEPGNCAHGVGHALLVLDAGDLAVALGHCGAFTPRPLAYYCASGVFMEHVSARRPGGARHFPCDTYTEYPPACYKYQAYALLAAHAGDVRAAITAECLPLAPPLRRGCVYGLGATQFGQLNATPERLADICGVGDADDRVMCVNGAMEILSAYQPAAATVACGSLTEPLAESCRVAVREGRYGLGKPFQLYIRD